MSLNFLFSETIDQKNLLAKSISSNECFVGRILRAIQHVFDVSFSHFSQWILCPQSQDLKGERRQNSLWCALYASWISSLFLCRKRIKEERIYVLRGASQVALVVKNLPANIGDIMRHEIPGSGRISGGGHGTPLQYSCLENPMDRGAWRATVHGVAKSWKQLKRLSACVLAHEKCRVEIEALRLTIHLLFHLKSWLVSGCHS